VVWSEGDSSQVEQVTLNAISNFSVYANIYFAMCGGEGEKENGKLFCCSHDNGLRLPTFHLKADCLANVPKCINLHENSPFALSGDILVI